MEQRKRINCPSCGREFEYTSAADSPAFPFCCRRCRLADLDKWLDGDYKITTDIADNSPNDRPESAADGQKGTDARGEKP